MTETEVCPYCEGTGHRTMVPLERAVVADRRGRRVGNPPHSGHGTNSTYSNGCRCAECRAAHRTYEKARRAQRKAS